MSKTIAKTASAQAPTVSGRPSLVMKFAQRFGVDAEKMLETLKRTAFRTEKEASNEQMMALLVVADQYGLNPWTKEIFAFEDKFKGIVPVVSIDGWLRIINERPELSAIEFGYAPDDAEDPWIECAITRKDRSKPIIVREYLRECARDTAPWKSHARRMLRHKALIQCARVAFGFAGIYDPDEGERISDANAIDSTATEVRAKPETRAPQALPASLPAPTEVPVAAIRRRLDETGIPENELCEQFGCDTLDTLALDKVVAAQEWIERVHAG